MRKRKPDAARESSLARGWVIEPEPELAAPPTDAPATAEPQPETEAGDPPGSQVSNAALVLFGVFGGLYLLYTWVWISWAQYYSAVNAAAAAGSGSIGGVLQQIVFWAVPFAPALWFITALVMSAKRTGRLALSLLAGAILLLPLPMLVSSGAAL